MMDEGRAESAGVESPAAEPVSAESPREAVRVPPLFGVDSGAVEIPEIGTLDATVAAWTKDGAMMAAPERAEPPAVAEWTDREMGMMRVASDEAARKLDHVMRRALTDMRTTIDPYEDGTIQRRKQQGIRRRYDAEIAGLVGELETIGRLAAEQGAWHDRWMVEAKLAASPEAAGLRQEVRGCDVNDLRLHLVDAIRTGDPVSRAVLMREVARRGAELPREVAVLGERLEAQPSPPGRSAAEVDARRLRLEGLALLRNRALVAERQRAAFLGNDDPTARLSAVRRVGQRVAHN